MNLNKKNQLFQRRTSYAGHDVSLEHVDKILQSVSKGVSAMLENSSTLDNSLYRIGINNIYVIGNFNASVVKMGESSLKKNPDTKDKKSHNSTNTWGECNSSEVKSTKINMPEYFDKAVNTRQSLYLNNYSTVMPTTENNLDSTYHYPAKTPV